MPRVKRSNNDELLYNRDAIARKVYQEENSYSQPQIISKQSLGSRSNKMFCSWCQGGPITYFPKTRTYLCQQCGRYTQAKPEGGDDVMEAAELLEEPRQSLRPPSSQVNSRGDDPEPFFASINFNDAYEDEKPYNLERSSPDGRVQHIRLKPGVSPTEYKVRDSKGRTYDEARNDL